MWQTGRFFILLMQWELGHLVGHITRGSKSLNGLESQGHCHQAERSRRGNSKALGWTVCSSLPPPAAHTVKPFLDSEIEPILTLDFGGQGNSTFGDDVFQF